MVKLTEAKLSSKHQITIPKKVINELGLESGDKLRLEVESNRIILVPARKISKPTEELYGSLRRKVDAVKAIRDFRKSGGRAYTLYLDTNVWLYSFTGDRKYGAPCKRILEDVEAGRMEAVISIQVVAEVSGVLYRQYTVRDTTTYVDAVLSYRMKIIPVTSDIVRSAAIFSKDYRILPYRWNSSSHCQRTFLRCNSFCR